MTTSHRGLRAVVRLRSVRERDARMGIAAELAHREALRLRQTRLEGAWADRPVTLDGTGRAILAARCADSTAAAVLLGARAELEAQGLVYGAAVEAWQTAHTRLRAVEDLLARKEAATAAERERRERLDLEEAATQRWLADRGDER